MSKPQDTPTPSKGVPITLDRPRFFRYTLGTLRKIREELGDEALREGVSGEKLAKVLCMGLQGDDPDLTPEKVEEIIDLQKLEEVVSAMRQAMGQKAVATVGPQPAAAPAAE
jgi:hypothetical protein